MFVKRILKVEIAASEAGSSVTTFEGLRTTVRITKANGLYAGTAHVGLFGLTLDHINDLSTKMYAWGPYKNFPIIISAGDPVNGVNQVFSGYVQQSWGDFTNMPDVVFQIIAQGTTAPAQVGPAEPTSATGAKVAPLIEKLAQKAGLKFQNHGVNTVLESLYHWGSPWKQMKEIADAAGVNLFVDDKVAHLWPKGKPIEGNFLVSRKTGMRDYPTFTERGIQVKVEFSKPINPVGSSITVESDLKSANGKWEIIGLDYDLAAELPGGNWFAIIEGARNLGGSVASNA